MTILSGIGMLGGRPHSLEGRAAAMYNESGCYGGRSHSLKDEQQAFQAFVRGSFVEESLFRFLLYIPGVLG